MGADVRGRTGGHGPLWFRDALHGRPIGFEPGQHVFIAGQTGAGKSRLMGQLIRHLLDGPALRGEAVVYGIDLKDGVEFARWGDRMRALATDLESATALLDDLDEQRRRRNETLRAEGRTVVRAGEGVPLLFVFIDELAELAGGVDREEKREQERAQRRLGRLLRLGRSAGITVVAATQDPRKEAVPLRDRFPNRVGLSLAGKEEARMLMGEDAIRDGCAPHGIPLSRPGTGYWYDRERREAVKFRTPADGA